MHRPIQLLAVFRWRTCIRCRLGGCAGSSPAAAASAASCSAVPASPPAKRSAAAASAIFLAVWWFSPPACQMLRDCCCLMFRQASPEVSAPNLAADSGFAKRERTWGRRRRRCERPARTRPWSCPASPARHPSHSDPLLLASG